MSIARRSIARGSIAGRSAGEAPVYAVDARYLVTLRKRNFGIVIGPRTYQIKLKPRIQQVNA